jgi:choice-of-anchor B domain-containing protein
MLTAAGLGGAARFGSALQWAGDQLLVGAPRALNATGAVNTYTFSAQDTSWTRTGRLLPFDGDSRRFFGAALAYDGTDLWVGAPGSIRMVFMYQNRARQSWPLGTGENRGGALYRFRRDGDDWTQANRIAHPGAASGDGLGATLAANTSVVATGLPGDDYGAGTAAFYSIAGGDWTHSAPRAPTQGARFSALTGEERSCADGTVDAFSCNRVDLKAFLPIRAVGGERGVHLTDIWGWTDPETGTEYALVGRSDGIAFVDVSTPTDPVYVGELPQTEKARVNSWGDVKVHENYAFAVADNAGDHGLQIFDLTTLRDVDPGEQPVTFEADAHYDRVNSVHNLFVNESTGYAYLVGSSGGGTTCGGGLHMVNVQDPLNPTFAGCFADRSTGRSGTGTTHDVQCVVYEGPDADYQGREICVGSNETAISIADVTNKDSTVALATGSYPDHAYVHQGWFGEDQRYFYQNDELDELQGKVPRTRTLVWDLQDLDNPTLVTQKLLSEKSSDHNFYVEGSLLYEANYKSGLRVLDVSDPTNPTEMAHFDTKPYGPNDPGFAGAWSNYPYFENGIVVMSSIDEGLFVLEKPRQGL